MRGSWSEVKFWVPGLPMFSQHCDMDYTSYQMYTGDSQDMKCALLVAFPSQLHPDPDHPGFGCPLLTIGLFFQVLISSIF
jgi:hypothetical protein